VQFPISSTFADPSVIEQPGEGNDHQQPNKCFCICEKKGIFREMSNLNKQGAPSTHAYSCWK
jgi:hypothetical protein